MLNFKMLFAPVLLLIFAKPAFAQFAMMGGYDFGFGFAGIFFMLIFWALVISGIVWLVRQFTQMNSNQKEKTALEVLQARLARGEITKKEYEEIKKMIAK